MYMELKEGFFSDTAYLSSSSISLSTEGRV